MVNTLKLNKDKHTKHKHKKHKHTKHKRTKRKSTKCTYYHKKNTLKKYKGSGPYDRPNKTPCKYGAACTRKNPVHFAEFSHPSPCRDGIWCDKIHSDEHFKRFTHPPYTRYENEDQVKQFIYECYDSYSRNPSDMFAHFTNSNISFLKKGIDDSKSLRKTFFFNLLVYIVCNICDIIVMPNGRDFISTMLQRFNEEAIDINFIVRDDGPQLQRCIQKLGIPYINCIAIVSVLQDPESEFNKNGCL